MLCVNVLVEGNREAKSTRNSKTACVRNFLTQAETGPLCSNKHHPGFRIHLSPGTPDSGCCKLQAVLVCAGDGVSLPVGPEDKDRNNVSLLPPQFLILHVVRNMDLSVYSHIPD